MRSRDRLNHRKPFDCAADADSNVYADADINGDAGPFCDAHALSESGSFTDADCTDAWAEGTVLLGERNKKGLP